MTPAAYKIVNVLKRKENENHYDRGTNFNPFHMVAVKHMPEITDY